MKKSLYPILSMFLIFTLTLEAQTDISIRKKDFKKEKDGLKEAWKHVKDGDAFFENKGIFYSDAYNEYLKANVYNNSNPELNYKTGVSALFSDNKEKSAGFLLKALAQKNNITDDILFVTGRALQFSGNYSDAKQKLEEYLTTDGKKPKGNIDQAQKWIEECRSALSLTKDTIRVEITNIGANINSNYDDYSELLTSDGKNLYFASRREIPQSSNHFKDSKFDENIFFSVLNSGKWAMAVPAGKDLTTKFCETPLFINSTNDKLFIYTGYENNGDIKVSSTNKKGIWRVPEKIPFNINTGGSETSLAFSPSGNEIYFVTDKGKDAAGGKDIYYIKKNKKRWSKPVNAGTVINTPYDEESVRFSQSGDTLWFSSKGHSTIGGFDLFYSVKNKAGEWDTVKNLGFPVNTAWDELFYHPSPTDDSSFFFVSNRSGGFGGFDIYEGRILPPLPVILPVPEPEQVPEPEPVPPPKPDTVIIRDTVRIINEAEPVVIQEVKPELPAELVLFLIGKVKDSETGDPVIAKIDIIDLGSNLAVATTASSDVDGSYRIRLPAKKSYMADFRGNGFLSEMKRINIPDTYTDEVFKLDVSLIKVKVGKKVVLNNILFESGKAILTQGSYAEIERLFDILKENANMKIEISGHTDKTGSEPLNFKLSEDRAKTVVEYLVGKGIVRSRLEYKGFGSLQPIDVNTTPAGRAKNRRVEFKILEF